MDQKKKVVAKTVARSHQVKNNALNASFMLNGKKVKNMRMT